MPDLPDENLEEEKRLADVVCLSHLKWEETLFQRPQQLMKQISGRRRVLYLSFCDTRAFFRALGREGRRSCFGHANARLFYLNLPYPPLTRHFPVFRTLLCGLIAYTARFLAWRGGFRDTWLWIYHPGYYPFHRVIPHKKLVYDCMDQFTAFSTSRKKAEKWEGELLKSADVVFTGGKSLQKAKEGSNPRTFCFPSGVDFDHFHQASLESTPPAEDIRDLPKPILGYFGAVDERIDFELVEALCRKRPDWSVVFVGPLVGMEAPPVDQANFHYLGRKEYGELPRYLKAFDVCLMPFVDSPLTRHISPTKTPEYLAGGKPVVSTPVPDVVEDYADVVRIARGREEFAEAVEAALRERTEDLSERLTSKASAGSWESVALEMERLIND